MDNIISQGIKESSKHFRQMNGNNTFSNKDLLIYLLTKMDTVEKEVTGQVTFCKTHMEEKKGYKAYLFQLITFLIAVGAVIVAAYN